MKKNARTTLYKFISKRRSKLVFLLILCCVAFSLIIPHSRPQLRSSRDASHSSHAKNSALELFKFISPNSSTLELCPEAPPDLVGPIKPDLSLYKFEETANMFPSLENGGHGYPESCQARHRVAIIVPCRDRESHLRIFLKNLHALLQKQQLDYGIFVLDQSENQTFNKAKLMNMGFVEARKLYNWDCFIFHDVDMIPENDRNMYTCADKPKHMGVAVDKFKYNLVYAQLVGGVVAFTPEQMEKINGFSNDYWGWGGEDDDIYNRLTYAGYKIHRDDKTVTRYKMIKHRRDKANPLNKCASNQNRSTKKRWKNDGLSNLNYTLVSIAKEPLFTRFKTDLLEKESKRRLREEEPFKC
ncbi:hypothetical protein L596_024782 [Steinernema carpocapsae]|uniref:Beta-1,4-N-acetylgalactosaminyltransferase n=1 Tax=Steinernema carpocapsae TaxID=34508 RepID=A0A4U5M5S0_STECR|nr:hypothetical protein L596_024782 [Steinernema carpocapsae]